MRNPLRSLLALAAVAAAATGVSPASAGTQATVTNRVDTVAVVGGDDALWVRATTEQGWRGLGGRLVDTPSIVRGKGVDYFVGLGADRNVYVRTLARDWQPLGPKGTVCSGPSAVISISTLAVACRGGDGALWVGKAAVPAGGALPVVTSFSSRGGALQHGVSVADNADYAQPTPTAAFVYSGVGTNSSPYFRTDEQDWRQITLSQCGGTYSESQYGIAGACQLLGSEMTLTLQYSAPEDQPTERSIPGRMRGRPGVSSDPDFVTRYYVVGADGAVWSATRDANGTITSGFTRFGGSAKYGVAVANYSS